MKTGTKRKRGERHPVEFVASELGVDRKILTARAENEGFRLNGAGITFREAYSALTSRQEEKEESRLTKTALREKAQTDAAKAKGLFVLKRSHEGVVADLAVQTRVVVERADYISQESRKRLSKQLAAIRVEKAPVAE